MPYLYLVLVPTVLTHHEADKLGNASATCAILFFAMSSLNNSYSEEIRSGESESGGNKKRPP